MHTEPDAGAQPEAREIVRHIEQLPAPPAVAGKVLSMVAGQDADFNDAARLIETDASLALKVLRMANTLAYGYRGKVESLDQAVRTLGFETLRNALLSVLIRDSLFAGHARGGDPLLTHLWKHSLTCAVTAQMLAETAMPEAKGAAFTAGLVHDCGQMVLLAARPAHYEPLVRRCRAGEAPLLALEAPGPEHTLVGKWLLVQWDMPRALVDVAWLHHQSPEALAGLGREGRLPALVGLADLLAHEVMCDAPVAAGADPEALAGLLGIPGAALEQVKARIGEAYAQRAAAFDLDGDAAGFYFEALQRANARLAGINADLDDQRRRLRRANRVLTAVTAAGQEMARAQAPGAVLDTLARVFPARLGAPRGFAYHVDSGAGTLNGLAWDEGAARPFRCGLDKNLAPVFGHGPDAPPQELRPVLTGYLTRIPAEMPDEASHMLCAPPWLILPLLAEGGFLGEVAFAPGDARSVRLPAEERAGFIQLADLASAALNRLELHERLEERAERLSSALGRLRRMNHKLLQAERLAAVGQLAAGAAHEINNPLAIIYARAQLLELRAPDEKTRADFRQMMAQIERITTILTNLMDFARPAPPHMEPLALNGVAERAMALVAGGLGKQEIDLVTELAPDLPPVTADGGQLEQVALNLLINAEHAVADRAQPRERGRITVATGVQGAHAFLTISDNGVGIPVENLDKIFDPFFTTKEQGRGTGLGLSTSYGIVQAHGGDIRFRSVPGSGTQVTVLLPLSCPAPQAARAAAQGRPERDTILVVDDERHIRDILRESLEARGYAVRTAEDGEQGLVLLERERFSLLLVDIRMPLRDGLSLLERARERIGATPVIVLTGMAGPEEIDKALRLGVFRCVRKPFQIDALLDDIAAALGRDPGGEAS
ncbi:HDOD domain-containing protein [Desulfocurvus vexinensis]|uniref:HDOD domain-containing protein n=1 Tax=Desulfocurvus vexinensis TaxID=399548 RepID=UPI00048B3CDD|nr:HDOD domain-containing protein [Desulfocurvus vexinensis]